MAAEYEDPDGDGDVSVSWQTSLDDVNWNDCYQCSQPNDVYSYIIDGISNVAAERKYAVIFMNAVRIRVCALGYGIVIPIEIVSITRAYAINVHHKWQGQEEEPDEER